MNPYWSNIVRQLAPYVPGEQPKVSNLVKLNTNENPFGPSPTVLAAIREALSDTLRLYPDPNASELKSAVANEYGLTNAHVFAGNGSDEVLAHTFLGLLKHDAPLLFADITYSFYPVYCGLYDISYELVPLDSDFCLDVSDYFERAAGAIIIANPNAPTGRALTRDQVEQLVKRRADVVVAVDEAYVDFGAETAAPLIAQYPNLLVIHTLSKSRSLAGLRVGYALGHPQLIEALERVKNCFNSYPLDRLAIAGAVVAMKDRAYFDATRAQVMASREQLTSQLGQLGFEVLPSKANFVFARHPRHDADELMRLLRDRSVIVRHFKLPRIDQYLRISIGTDEQCSFLVSALGDILRSSEKP
ncbi:MAG TPA: histidinol-phosphate transaminase [Polyangiaceae bacterium]